MAIKNTNTSPLLKEGANITLTQSGQVITIAANDTTNAPGGSDTQVQFNDGGNFGGDAGLTYNKTTNVLGVESIDFAQTPAAADSVRRLKWDEDEGSLVLTLKGGNLTIPIGAEVVTLVYNAEATTLTKGTVVYAFGASGQRVSVKRAVNTGDSTSAQTLGVVAESIASGAEGWVMVQGLVRGIDTSGYTQGDALYLGSTAGTFTKTKVYAPNHLVYIGFAVKINASSGEIFVKCQNGYELDELHNVDAHNPTNNDGIFWNSSTNLWEHKSIVTVLGYTPAPASRMITINGTSQDLTADRTWSVGTVMSIATSAPITGGTITGSGTIGITQASGSSDGYLSSGDWTTFNNKQNALTNPVTGTGTSGQVAYFNGTTSITSESNLFWDASNDRLGIKVTPSYNLSINGSAGIEASEEYLYFHSSYVVGSNARAKVRAVGTGGGSGYGGDFRVSTRATNNTWNEDAFVVDYGGRVGIGTATPNYQLDSQTTSTYITNNLKVSAAAAANNYAEIAFQLWAGAGSGENVFGGSGTSRPSVVIRALSEDNSAKGALVIGTFTGGATNANLTEKVRITSGGNIGIGTDNPIVAGGGYTGVHINGSSDGASLVLSRQNANIVYLYTFGTSGDFAIENPGAQIFRAGSSEKMRIFSTGNVFIGSSPSDAGYKLDVNGTGRFSGTIYSTVSAGNAALDATTTTSAFRILHVGMTGGDAYIGTASSTGGSLLANSPAYSMEFRNDTGFAWGYTTSNMILNSSGNLGLGVTPTVKLQVETPSTGNGVIFRYTGGTNNPGLFVQTEESSKNVKLIASGSVVGGQLLQLGAEGSTCLNIGANNVGLGVTPSSWASGIKSLEINYAGNGLWSSTPTQLIANSNAYYASGGWTYASNNPSAYYSQFSGGHYWYNAPSGTAGNSITFTQAMTLASTGNLLVGTTTDSGERLIVSGDAKFSNKVTAVGLLVSNDRLWLNGNRPISDWISSSLTAGYSSTNSYGWINSADNLVLGTNGSERARLDSSGNLGLGVSPSTKLHVYQSTTDNTTGGRTTPIDVLTLETENTAAVEYNGFGQGIVFRGSTYNNATQRTLGRILHQINDDSINTTRGTSLAFQTLDDATTTNAPTTKLLINYAGNLGLGVTPSAWGSSYKAYELNGGALWGANNGAAVYLTQNAYFDTAYKYVANGYATEYYQYLGTHVWRTAPNNTSGAGAALTFTQAMTLDASGRLGIGRTPSAKFHVYSTGGGLELTPGATTILEFIDRDNTSATVNTEFYTRNGSFAFYNGAYTKAMTLDASGNLGVNATPSSWIASWKVIQGNSAGAFGVASANNGMYVMSNAYYNTSGNPIYTASNYATMYQQINGGHYWYYTGSGTAGNTISWTTGMQLTANGDLIIGSGADTGESLQVTGDAKIAGFLGVSHTAGLIGNFNSTNANGGYLTWQTSGTTIADLGTVQQVFGSGGNDTFGINARGARSLTLGTNNTQRFALSSTGQLKLNNYTTTTSFSGTPVGLLAFEADGDIVTTSISGAGGIGGSTGSVDNAILRADGIGGSTVQSSAILLDDDANLQLGTTSVSSAQRSITASGSASDIALLLFSKNAGRIRLQSAGYINLTSNGDNNYRTQIEKDASAIANAVVYPLDIFTYGFTSFVSGIGTGLRFYVNTGTNNNEYGGAIECICTDTTATSEDFDVTIKTMAAGAGPTERVRIKSTGQLQLNNYTSTSSFTGTEIGTLGYDASGNILSLGLPAVESKNTWTPAFSNSGATIVYATNGQVGYYVKYGSMVTITFRLALTTGTTMTGNALTITGLPFTSANTTNQEYICTIAWTSSVTSFVNAQGRISPNSSTLTLLKTTAASANSTTAMVGSDIGTGSVISGTITYFV